uniref:Uncharacterized protein n=1 Tax=Octopus bimaculoides TaxID=37653 RepID=A0A0L8IBU1_OCTBM
MLPYHLWLNNSIIRYEYVPIYISIIRSPGSRNVSLSTHFNCYISLWSMSAHQQLLCYMSLWVEILAHLYLNQVWVFAPFNYWNSRVFGPTFQLLCRAFQLTSSKIM